MPVDFTKVNLLEKDIEDYLFENPSVMPRSFGGYAITHWIGRQYRLPSGIADLIGVRSNGMVVVVEVKNVPVDKAAILQVCRYAHDLRHVLSNRVDYEHVEGDWNDPIVEMIVIGPSVDGQTFIEAQSVGVRVLQFLAAVTLNIWQAQSTVRNIKELRDQQAKIAARPEWDKFGLTVEQDMKRIAQEGRDHRAALPLAAPQDEFEIPLPAALLEVTDDSASTTES